MKRGSKPGDWHPIVIWDEGLNRQEREFSALGPRPWTVRIRDAATKEVIWEGTGRGWITLMFESIMRRTAQYDADKAARQAAMAERAQSQKPRTKVARDEGGVPSA